MIKGCESLLSVELARYCMLIYLRCIYQKCVSFISYKKMPMSFYNILFYIFVAQKKLTI